MKDGVVVEEGAIVTCMFPHYQTHFFPTTQYWRDTAIIYINITLYIHITYV